MRISVIRRLVGVLAVAGLGVLPLAVGGPALAAKPSGATFNPNLLLQGSSNSSFALPFLKHVSAAPSTYVSPCAGV